MKAHRKRGGKAPYILNPKIRQKKFCMAKKEDRRAIM
jgi:hypothetical protein